ncbi:MAG TPA: hypothetical protein G4N96_07050 [Chloroflexi bacterium]|nr:MAG: hypothetical protein B6243_03045 [Anaerolineaceae bacterium 4572_5.2]HEY84852.1 hypothetical protein [Chloroflexota bacterium]
MSETQFIVYLDEAQRNRYRHWHIWRFGEITGFLIQYEAFINEQWYPVVRYDATHGQPHRDVLHPDGSQSKEMYSYYNNAEVVTIGKQDIFRNWQQYRASFEREMER